MAYRDFAAARSEAEREPIAFSLGGERFECLPKGTTPVTGALLAFSARPLTFSSAATFVRDVIEPGDEERFDKLRARKHEPVEHDVVMSLAMWLVEVYTGRPTLRSHDSPPGSSTAGSTSTGEPSGEGEDSSSSPPGSAST